MSLGVAELVQLELGLGQADMRDPRRRQDWSAGLCGELERPPIGGQRVAQSSLVAQHPAQLVGRPGGHRGLRVLQIVDVLGKRPFRLVEPTAQPRGDAELEPGDCAKHRRVVTDFRQRHLGKRPRAFRVAPESGQGGTLDRDHGRDIHQHARRRADGRLVGLAFGIRGRMLGGIKEALDPVQVAVEQGQHGLRQKQARAGIGQLIWLTGQPPLHGCLLAAQNRRIEVALDQAGRPQPLPRGLRVIHGVIG